VKETLQDKNLRSTTEAFYYRNEEFEHLLKKENVCNVLVRKTQGHDRA
jgi:hypothetical protein